jgi:hypothetical protein
MSDWQPISTSPRAKGMNDTQRFLIATSKGQVLVVEPHPNGWVYTPYSRFGSPAQSESHNQVHGYIPGQIPESKWEKATHWMPLPLPPRDSEHG